MSHIPEDPSEMDYEERAAILEYEAGFPRAEAERLARAMTQPPPALPMKGPHDLTRT